MTTVTLCQCGCGLLAPISNRTDPRVGAVLGKPRRYIQYHSGHIKADPTRHTVIEAGFATPCWRYAGSIGKDGYGIQNSKSGPKRMAHRISYEITNGPIPRDLEIDHLCRNRWCINPSHLEAVTRAVNMQRGRLVKLSVEQVLAVRALQGRERTTVVAEQFGISQKHVRVIWARNAWRNL